jgi:hypothetical protein
MVRLIQKWLKAGAMEDGQFLSPQRMDYRFVASPLQRP